MLFVIRSAILAIALALSNTNVVAGECTEVPITKENLQPWRTKGWVNVRLIVLFDWRGLPERKGILFPLVVEMDPAKARPDLDRWVQRIRACPGYTEYVVGGERKKRLAQDGREYAWLQAWLLLPADEVARKVPIRARLCDNGCEGRWETWGKENIFVLAPRRSKP